MMDALLKQLDSKLSSCLDITADGFVMRGEGQSLKVNGNSGPNL